MYLLMESAMISVPPVLPPWVMMMAMPIPLMAPPMRALIRLSVMPADRLVRPGIMGMNWKNTKLMATQYIVLMQYVYRELGVGDGDAVDTVVNH